MRVKITTDREPWAGGTSHAKGSTPDLDAEEARILIDAGFAEAVDDEGAAPAPRRRARAEAPEA